MSSSLPFLALPSLALLAVFTRLQASLRDVVALSSTCRELWSLGAAARRRHVCCAACGHRLLQASLALASDTHRQAPPHPRLPDGPAWAVDVEHALAPHGGCVLGEAELVREADAYFVRVRGLHRGAALLGLPWTRCMLHDGISMLWQPVVGGPSSPACPAPAPAWPALAIPPTHTHRRSWASAERATPATQCERRSCGAAAAPSSWAYESRRSAGCEREPCKAASGEAEGV